MSDYFLNKIYDSLLSNKPVPKKPVLVKESKKPSTLEQAYHNIALKRVNEETEILMQQQPSGDVEHHKISDELASKIKKDIRKETAVNVDQKQTTVKKEIDEVLKLKGWYISPKEYTKTLEEVVHAFTEEEIVPENFIKYSQTIQEKNNALRNTLLSNPKKPFEYLQLVPEWFHNLFRSGNANKVVNMLWDVTPKLQPAIGNGEIAFTLLSDAKKGETGDLYFDEYGHVELKGIGGFMDGDGHVNTTPQELNSILAKETHISDITLNRIKTEIINDLKDFEQKRTKTRGTQTQDIETIKRLITTIEDNIQDDNSVEDLKQTISSTPKIIQDKLLGKLDKYLKYARKEVKNDYRGATLTFFSMYDELSEEQLVDGVFAARNFSSVESNDRIKQAIKLIIDNNTSNLFNNTLKTNKFTYPLACLIAALHAVLYHEKKQFKGLLFLNDNNKKIVYYNFESEQAADNLSGFYNFLLNFKPSISLSMSSQQKGASFSFFK